MLGGAADIVSGVGNVALGAVTGSGSTISAGLGQIGSGVGGVAMGTLDLAGKAWNAPNTAIGLTLGLAGWALGGSAPTLGNNAIQFTNSGVMSKNGAITIGNVILYGSNLGPTTEAPEGGHLTGDHEGQHTYQGQVLGPTYLPLAGISLLVGTVVNGDAHGPASFMERGPQRNPPGPWPWH